MEQVKFGQMRLAAGRKPTDWTPWLGWFWLSLFGVQAVVVLARMFGPEAWFGGASWPFGVLLILAAVHLLTRLAAGLPFQNVLLVGAICLLIAGGMFLVGALTGIPFGPFSFTPAAGPTLVAPLPAVVPVLWLVLILAARGVARLILRPWRKTRKYGYWMIGMTTVLVVWFDLGLEPYASRVANFWLWHPTRLPVSYYGAPVVNFLGLILTLLLALAFATPALINKRRSSSPPDYQPLIIWLVLGGVVAAGLVSHGFWLPFLLLSAALVAPAAFAWRGAHW